MKRGLTAVVTVAWLLTAVFVPAASQDPQASVDVEEATLDVKQAADSTIGTARTRGVSKSIGDLEVAEDLEIMGEVLRAALARLYSERGYSTVMTENVEVQPGVFHETLEARRGMFWSSNVVPVVVDHEGDGYLDFYFPSSFQGATVERPEGAYLDDYGVVYHVRLNVPPPAEQRPEDPAKRADEAVVAPGPWEDAMRSLRGQPLPEPRGAVVDRGMPTKAELVNKLVHVLAENARNFRHLGPQDRLTVAITFPRRKAPVNSVDDTSNRDPLTAPWNRGMVRELPAPNDTSNGTLLIEENRLPGYGESLLLPNVGRVVNLGELSGDLHIRQGNYRKAIEAYEKALSALSQRPPPDGTKIAGAVMRKLIQACAAAGDLEKARTLIDMALASKPKGEDDSSSPAAARAIPLPARLIVSASQDHLNQFAAGKMTREQLSKYVVVDYFKPPAGVPGVGARRSQPSSGKRGSADARPVEPPQISR